MVIYKLTNLINGKIYIGQNTTNDPKYLGGGKILGRAKSKYGRDNFSKEILEICSTFEELNAAEIKWIEYFNSTDRKIGYNILKGGQNAYITGKNNGRFGGKGTTEQTKKIISEKAKNRKATDQTRRILSKARKGNKNPMHGTSAYNKWVEKYGIEEANRKREEIKEKLSKSGQGKKRNDQAKDRLSNSKLGTKNPMSGKSLYSIWLEKYGKEIADQKKLERSEKIKLGHQKRKMHSGS